VPNAGDKRVMTSSLRPFDSLSLRLEGTEHVVGMVFNNVIVDPAPLRPTFGPCLDIDIRHPCSSTKSVPIVSTLVIQDNASLPSLGGEVHLGS
jgi:hypothetical protein